MNRVTTTYASPTKRQPLVANAGAGSIPFIEDGIQEAMSNIMKGLLGSYITNDVIILYGVVVTLTTVSTSNDTAAWTAGAIYYNGEVYTVDASPAPLTKTSGVFLYSILVTNDPTNDPVLFSDNKPYNVHDVRKITITKGTSGTGIADYGASTVKSYFKSEDAIIGISNYFEADFVPENSTGSVVFAMASYIKQGNVIHLQMQVNVSVSAVGSGNHWYNIKIIPPPFAKCKKSLAFLIGNNFGGLGNVGLNSDSNGDILTSYDNTFTASVTSYSHVINLTYEIE